MSSKQQGELVCVTGASGCIGSWLVRLLLARGYSVQATVQNLNDESETKHLQALDGAEARLSLVQIDLLDYASIAAAVRGCAGVFHLASPCTVDPVLEPEKEILDPAIKGTTNVLTAAKEAGVGRVVITSSTAAMYPNSNWPDGKVLDEDSWLDIDYCRQNGLWYPVSKALAEKAAWEFAKENGLDVVVVNPGAVMGSVIPPRINSCMVLLLRLLQGSTETYKDFFIGTVDFKDVAMAHILVYENKLANGRHLCAQAISHYGDFAAKVAQLYPNFNLTSLPRDTQPGVSRAERASTKLIELGMEFTPIEQMIKDSVESLKNMGYISLD